MINCLKSLTLRKTFPYLELFWSAFFPHFPAFGLNTERYFPHFSAFGVNTKRYGVSLRIQSKSGKCGKNVDQNNSEYGHFLRSVKSICNAVIAPKITLVRYIESDDDIRSFSSEPSVSKNEANSSNLGKTVSFRKISTPGN